MRLKATSDLWWKNAVVYCLDVETFLDSDGDGCGDLPGLTDRLDYLAGLGVSCLWLMPFYPSRQRDDGYDITDFYGIDGRLGTPGDFAEMIRTAADRGIRVIADLVVNHTSDQHPWFQSGARPRLAVPRLLRLGRREAARRSPATSCSPTGRTPTGRTTARPGSGICTASTPTSPTSTSPTPRSATRSPRSSATGCCRAWPASASTRCRSCSSRSGMPEGALHDPHELPARPAPLHGPPPRRRDPHGRGQPRAGPAARVLRRRGRRRAAHGPQLRRQPGHVPGARARRRDAAARRAGGAARRSPRTASGRTSSATTTSSRSTSSPTTSAPRSSPRSGPTRSCSSTGAACAGGCPPWSAATSGGCA